MSKTLYIAGAGPGVSAAVARRFHAEGFHVALFAREQAKLDALAADLGERALGYACDLAKTGEIVRAFATARATIGPATVLVYNAAGVSPGLSISIDPERFHADLHVSITSALWAVQATHDDMQAAGGGTILFIGGGLALNPALGLNMGSLTVGKAGIRALAHVLNGELAPDNIHVATVTIAGFVAPGGPFDPAKIAETYWRLHQQDRSVWEPEIVFDGRD